MTNPKIIPQKFSFEKPTTTNGNGKIISHWISVTVDIDAFKSKQIRNQKVFKGVMNYECIRIIHYDSSLYLLLQSLFIKRRLILHIVM